MITFIKRFILFLAVLAISFIAIGLLFAAEEVDLDRIVVSTANRYEEEIQNIPASVNVITASQIKDSNAQTIPEVLKTQTGLIVRDWYGNGTKTWVDLRGFGEFSAMNVLVMVDGRRINEVDLSGVDWTQIPLNQVESIEVLRGSGSVLYGDNATAGVINIRTKKGKGKPRWEITTEVGSYDTNKQKISLDGSEDNLAYFFALNRDSTHGYRKNSYYKGGDFGSKLTYDIEPDLSLRFSSGLHNADFGLPGELSDTDLQTMSRRSSKYGDDHALDTDYYFDIGGKKDFPEWGDFDIDFSFRRRQTDSFWLVFFGGSGNPISKTRIDTVGITPKFVIDKEFSGRENKLIFGLDYYRADYLCDNYNYSDILQNFTDINKISTGYYLQDELALFKELYLLGGYRYEKVRYEFDYNNISGSDPLDKNVEVSGNAFNSGLVYHYQENSSLFLNHSRSFRFPATEEYSITWPTHSLNTALKPQEAKNYEIGLKHRFNPGLKTELTFFRMDVENELYYDYASYSNKNYDKTRHDGMELAFDAMLTKNIGLSCNYTYTKALFRGGIYDEKTIPMVPRNKGKIGIKYLFNDKITVNLLTNYVGERYFINDQANSLSRLNGYFTADTNISYAYKDLTVVLGVNNILNKKYSEYATCDTVYTVGKKVYYPAPERNFTIRMGYKF
jgi:iron complex outermembrane receptor protein